MYLTHPTHPSFPPFHTTIFLLLLHHSIINSNYFLILFYDVANDWQPRHLLQLSVYFLHSFPPPLPSSLISNLVFLLLFFPPFNKQREIFLRLCVYYFYYIFFRYIFSSSSSCSYFSFICGNWRRKSQSGAKIGL